MQKPIFVSIIILFECVVSIVCSGYALWIFARLTWASFNSKTIRLNWPLKIYAILQILLAITTIVYLLFLVLFWRLQNSAYDLYWLYFTGGIQNCVLMILALAVSALGIDRCLIVKFPTKHLTIIPLITFIVMTVIWIAINIVLRMIPAYPKNTIDKKDCENVGCLGSFYTNIVYYSLRFTASGINFAVGILLTLLLKQMPIVSNCTVKSSRLVLYAIVTTLSFDLLPHFVSIVVYRVFQINFADYVGPYSTIFGAIENAICAFFYRRTFKVGALTSHDTLTVPHHSHPTHPTPITVVNSKQHASPA
uniref:G_PROTEIN_RECEP_F1_2 domain-containing protein n=1 Tax=Panagrellus redivivus TaxID=6233 RepID=A0A7E4V0T9_PANRE